MPDLKKQFGLNYEHSGFLIKYHKLPKRTLKISTNSEKTKNKRKKFCQEKYGVDNPSQRQEIKDKKAATFLKNYGVDNIWKSKEFWNNIDLFYQKKYSKTFKEWLSEKSKNTWEVKTKEEKDEWLEKSILSEKSRYNLCHRVRGGNSSNAEKFIGLILDSLNIKYIKQFRIQSEKIKRYYDFYIPSINLIIEFNGTYWHADPFKYKENDIIRYKFGNVYAKDIWERDKIKLDLAKNNGYCIITIWERETKNKNIEQLIKLVKEKISNYDSKK